MYRSFFITVLSSLVLAGTMPSVQAQEIKSEKVRFRLNNLPEAKQTNAPDTESPVIEIIAPVNRAGDIFQSSVEEIDLIGQVIDQGKISFLSINSKVTEINENGIFSYPFKLNPGFNQIRLVAMDDSRNLTEQTLTIQYMIPVYTLAERIQLESKYYALIIGIDQYTDPELPDLSNAVSDAEELYNTLVNHYTFEEENMSLLKNATRGEIVQKLDELSTTIGNNDNLLIFYAGHGWWDEISTNGYWLPADAQNGVKTNWFRNSALVDYLKEIRSKHTLLITDACFAGSIFQTRAAFPKREQAFEKLYDLPSRKAMTSGMYTEVPDKSAFMQYLLERLEENDQIYLSSYQLFSDFRIAVMNNSKAVPQYGEIRNVGDQGGDFIFLHREE